MLGAACAADQPRCPETDNTVIFTTNHGEMTIELYPDEAPITVENFLAYVDAAFYDSTLFHRIVPGFVIQGGGRTLTGMKETRAPIANEADNGLLNERGTLSMARRPDPNSATSQFFINLEHNEILDHGVRDFGYAVFGRVVAGMDVVDRIAALPTGPNEAPHEPVIILKACSSNN
ncbi:MAG: peptidylprolyl isomerase [Gemmatimonadota bacterium]|nr:MAG: peptidylprolyl isomerase [Gemmatimonadota bacterium]